MIQKLVDKSSLDRIFSSGDEAAAAVLLKRYAGRRRLAAKLFEVFLKPFLWFESSHFQSSLEDVRSILVFEPGSLGDIVMLVPFLRTLRARFPTATIALLCRAGRNSRKSDYSAIDPNSIETLLLNQKLVDELLPLPVPWLVDVSIWKKYNPFSSSWPAFAWQVRRLATRKFDLAFPGGRSDIRYNFVLWLAGARRRVGYGYAGGGSLLTDLVVPDPERPHQSDLSLQLLEHLGIPTAKREPLLSLSALDKAFSATFCREHGIAEDDLVVGVHPGSRVPTRTWSEERFREVAQRLRVLHNAKVIWFSEPGRTSSPPLDGKVISASLVLSEFLPVLARCDFIVCNESGPMHLAAAVGTPAVAVFGSGFPEWFGPLGERHRVVIRRDIWCRPCADHCRWSEPYCLKFVSVDQVMKDVEHMANSAAKHPMKMEEGRDSGERTSRGL